MVTRNEAEQESKARRTGHRDLDAALSQLFQKASRRTARSGQSSNSRTLTPAARARMSSRRRNDSRLRPSKDVALQRDAGRGLLDETIIASSRTVAQQRDAVAARDVGSRDPPKAAGKGRSRDNGYVSTAAVHYELTHGKRCRHSRCVFRMCAEFLRINSRSNSESYAPAQRARKVW